jgi:phosphate transport system substrate-binding protein
VGGDDFGSFLRGALQAAGVDDHRVATIPDTGSGMSVAIVDQKGDTVWPVTTASFILMYKDPTDRKQSAEALKFFDWAFKNGQKAALDLDYVPLPDVLTQQIRDRVWTQIKK